MEHYRPMPESIQTNRRSFALVPGCAICGATATAQTATPQRFLPFPTPRDWTGHQPIQYPDPDIIALDNRFRKYIIGNTSMKRLHTGTSWAEGPAWNGTGRYLVWSDIPANVQLRWIEDDGRTTVFHNPSPIHSAAVAYVGCIGYPLLAQR